MGVAFGPFELQERLAVGGSGEVWIARRDGGPKLVVKRLLPSLLRDPDARASFAKEAALYARCVHRNVVGFHGAGFAEDEPWLAMELVVGADLATVLRAARENDRPLSPGVAVYLAREVLAALAAVHEAKDEQGAPLQIVHRDVTPSNVFLSLTGAVKLGDFGIARFVSSTRTPAQLGVRGKFAYLAPEQVAGEEADARTDLFAVANVLVESMIGRRLFDGAGQLAVLLAVRDARLDNLRSHAASLPPDLVAVLERALDRDPAKRYQDARALSAALAPFAADEAIARFDLAERVVAVRGGLPAEDEELRESVPPIVAAPPSMFPSAMESLPPRVSSSRAITLETSEYSVAKSRVRTTDGRTLGPYTYAEIVDMVVSGKLAGDDEVDFQGTGFVPLRSIDAMASHLEARETATTRFAGPRPPDWWGPANDPSDVHEGNDPGIGAALAWAAARYATGALFATRDSGRVEIYFDRARVVQVAENGVPRTQQGAVAAIVALFPWTEGELAFFRDERPKLLGPNFELAVGPLIEAGVNAVLDDAKAAARRKAWNRKIVARDAPAHLRSAEWSPVVERVIERARTPIDPSELVDQLGTSEADAVRAIGAARIGRLVVPA